MQLRKSDTSGALIFGIRWSQYKISGVRSFPYNPFTYFAAYWGFWQWSLLGRNFELVAAELFWPTGTGTSCREVGVGAGRLRLVWPLRLRNKFDWFGQRRCRWIVGCSLIGNTSCCGRIRLLHSKLRIECHQSSFGHEIILDLSRSMGEQFKLRKIDNTIRK